MMTGNWLVNQIKEIVKGIIDKQPTDKLGRIDSQYTSGLPKIIFDGEDVASGKGYPFLSSYKPQPNERVYLKAVKGSYIILGRIERYEAGEEPVMKLPPNPTPVTPTFINGWSNFYSGSLGLRYYKNGMNQLVMRGIIKNEDPTSLSVIFVLPTSHWPKQRQNVPVSIQNGVGEISVNEVGEVKFSAFLVGSQSNYVHANLIIPLD
ncbi:hypothetical protein [Planomicrobium sp. CPCC 101079]|uniref:hypothetical protein n=1 Tax=Planomicrobium sp. CPCC 101079 TaxID=2599618 RepID=UPI0011B834D3|nr:hypothetical protein [Planomicrobium sp. CPCC 101079]TWT04595.1 hypothetical protein FQV28_08305 [Planomicrobium sp. CPCC 101079]